MHLVLQNDYTYLTDNRYRLSELQIYSYDTCFFPFKTMLLIRIPWFLFNILESIHQPTVGLHWNSELHVTCSLLQYISRRSCLILTGRKKAVSCIIWKCLRSVLCKNQKSVTTQSMANVGEIMWHVKQNPELLGGGQPNNIAWTWSMLSLGYLQAF